MMHIYFQSKKDGIHTINLMTILNKAVSTLGKDCTFGDGVVNTCDVDYKSSLSPGNIKNGGIINLGKNLLN